MELPSSDDNQVHRVFHPQQVGEGADITIFAHQYQSAIKEGCHPSREPHSPRVNRLNHIIFKEKAETPTHQDEQGRHLLPTAGLSVSHNQSGWCY